MGSTLFICTLKINNNIRKLNLRVFKYNILYYKIESRQLVYYYYFALNHCSLRTRNTSTNDSLNFNPI